MREKPRDINSARNPKDSAAPRGLTRRRLAAIVAGDIAGLSRLMDLDEEGTHARVKRIRRDLIEPSIAGHHGRLVKATGDGFIAIFDSPLKAVQCAIIIQQHMSGRNTSLPRDQWIQYRIGINLDLIIEEDDIYGDGVKVEYCLESVADPGEVCISGDIYEQIKHKLACRYELLDDRKVENIADPARVYRVLPDPIAFSKARRPRENAEIFLPSFLQSFVLLVIVGGALWYALQQPYGNAPRRDHASTPVPPRMTNAPSSALAGGNQLSQSAEPPPSAGPATQEASALAKLAAVHPNPVTGAAAQEEARRKAVEQAAQEQARRKAAEHAAQEEARKAAEQATQEEARRKAALLAWLETPMAKAPEPISDEMKRVSDLPPSNQKSADLEGSKQPSIELKPLTNTPELVRTAQKELSRLGCFVGKADGNLSNTTTKAIKHYLTVQGRGAAQTEVTAGLVSELQKEESRVCAPDKARSQTAKPAKQRDEPEPKRVRAYTRREEPAPKNVGKELRSALTSSPPPVEHQPEFHGAGSMVGVGF